MAAPNLEADKTDFIIQRQNSSDWYSEFAESEKDDKSKAEQKPKERKKKSPNKNEKPVKAEESEDNEFDLSDITHQQQEQSREEIIAAAEAAAFESA